VPAGREKISSAVGTDLEGKDCRGEELRASGKRAPLKKSDDEEKGVDQEPVEPLSEGLRGKRGPYQDSTKTRRDTGPLTNRMKKRALPS